MEIFLHRKAGSVRLITFYLNIVSVFPFPIFAQANHQRHDFRKKIAPSVDASVTNLPNLKIQQRHTGVRTPCRMYLFVSGHGVVAGREARLEVVVAGSSGPPLVGAENLKIVDEVSKEQCDQIGLFLIVFCHKFYDKMNPQYLVT